MTRRPLAGLLILVLVAACGGKRARPGTTKLPTPVATRTADWMVPLLPEGAQVVVEADLARLRANPVVGELATRILAELGADSRVPGLPITVQGSPLATADSLVLGAYGVGTANASTVIILATKGEVTGGTRLTSDLVTLGAEDWTSQIAARAAIGKLMPDAPAPLHEPLTVRAADELVRLRDHAMPDGAPGAILRITARLSFDARITLARTIGLETAPSQISIWADVVDDFAIIIDVDAADPGDKNIKAARARMTRTLRAFLAAVAAEPAVRALGVAGAIEGARFVEQGTWVRAIIAVGPRQLGRVVERAKALLPPPS